MSSTRKILFVFTSARKTSTGANTGWYLPEAVHPYYVLSPHFDIDFAAPRGPNPPVDERSACIFRDHVTFLDDPTVATKLRCAKRLSDVQVADYDAIFYVGGRGAVIDLAVDKTNIALASAFYQAGKVTAAVSHGAAALVGAVDASGKPIFAGQRVTAFSNLEEELLLKCMPFLIEYKIGSLGGIYEKAGPWEAKVVVSGHLITGQNTDSARGVGEAILRALKP